MKKINTLWIKENKYLLNQKEGQLILAREKKDCSTSTFFPYI